MIYLMKQFKDEWGYLYQYAVRKTPYKNKEKAKKAMKKLGKGAFLMNNKHHILEIA